MMKMAEASYRSSIDFVLEKRNDIDLDIQDNYGKTLLMHMIENSLNDSIKKLLENNQIVINLNLADANNKTALFYAFDK
ncbi:TPA: hypothetical protein DCZ31_05780 [Patescibacteria group bacterium]|nr:hypothetical protein [Candidatus Gracilibacteria bacterium]